MIYNDKDITPMDKDGLRHGYWVRHKGNGNIYYEGKWVHGNMDGLCIVYHDNKINGKEYYII